MPPRLITGHKSGAGRLSNFFKYKALCGAELWRLQQITQNSCVFRWLRHEEPHLVPQPIVATTRLYDNGLWLCFGKRIWLAHWVLYLLVGGGGPPKRFSERSLNRISGLAGSIEEPVKGYEPQSSRTMYRPLRPASLEKKQTTDRLSRSTRYNRRRIQSDARAPDPAAQWR